MGRDHGREGVQQREEREHGQGGEAQNEAEEEAGHRGNGGTAGGSANQGRLFLNRAGPLQATFNLPELAFRF